MKYQIVYNLVENETLNCFIPESILCTTDKNGQPEYYHKKAIPETLDGLSSVQYLDTPHQKLITIVADLQECVLSKKFKPKGKRKVDFKIIAADKTVLKLCQNHINKQVDILLKICRKECYPVTIDLPRKEVSEKFRLSFSEEDYSPKLFFKKTEEGINYKLGYLYKDILLLPSVVKTKIVSNKPGWITMGNQLIETGELNGNKLKPFLKKQEINIPSRTTKQYFQKFIMELVPKVEINTEGFLINKSDTIITKELKLIENLFSGEWQLKLIFQYEHISFPYGSGANSKTTISFTGNDNIVIVNQLRDIAQEDSISESLISHGLTKTESGTFELEENSQTHLLNWLKENSDYLSQEFNIENHEIDLGGKKINLKAHTLEINCLKENDWFDIAGYVRVGNQDIPFRDLLENIKDENPFYLLQDGTYFVIPEEWMNKYSSLAKFGNREGDKFLLAKNHIGLLEELGEAESSSEQLNRIVVDDVDIEYKPSPLLKAQLRPYQKTGVEWLLKHQLNGLGACLADDMGLGKTLQVVAALVYTKEHSDPESTTETESGQLSMFGTSFGKELNPLGALIIVPASLVFNWLAELKKFAPHLKVTDYIGPKRKSKATTIKLFDVVVTTYQTALKDIDILKKSVWTYVVLDESHYIKNRNAKIFKGLSELPAVNKISLSGTPIENSLSDLWSQMEFINPEILGSFDFFKEHFKVPIEKNKEEAAIEELQKIINPFLLRRTKEEVAKDLPEKMEQVVTVEMSEPQKKCFEKQKSAARNSLLDMDESDKSFHIHVFKELLALRQISNHPILFDKEYEHNSGKLDLVISQIETIVKSRSKVLVFSSFTSYLDIVAKELEQSKINYTKLTGSTTQKNRQQAVNDFQSKEDINVFLISIKAGGTGLNLTEAEYVIILDPWWNPFVEDQAIARAHRIGQKNTVHVLKYISKDSIEEKILLLQQKKKLLNESILTNAQSSKISKDDLKDLLS